MSTTGTRVALIRHGLTDWNEAGRLQGRTDIPLNAIGRRQAHQVGLALQQESWDALYTSPLIRARETADLIGSALNVPPQIVPDLVERNFGHLEGLTRAELNQAYPNRAHQPGPAGVESPETLRLRAESCLRSLAEAHRGQGIVVVSHGAWINALLYQISDGTYGTGITNLTTGGISHLQLEPESAWVIVGINASAHLDHVQGQTDRSGSDRKVVGRERNEKDAPRG